MSRQVATWRDEQGSKGERFGYDAIGQLTSAAYNADQVWTGNPLNATHNTTYTLNPLNRLSVTANGTATGYSSNGINQYTAVGSQTLAYDGNFNLTGYNGASFIYNAAGQLTLASKGGNSIQFTYDGLGRCVRRMVNGVARIFTYDGWKPMLEWDGAGNFMHWNIYGAGPDEILARNDGLLYKQDHRGSVVALLGGSGNVIEKYTYDAFGKPTITDQYGNVRTESAYGNRFMFTGREYIKELGIYDYRNRMYHPELGRFLQKDPIGFDAGDANLFRYCNDDPVNLTDPEGTNPFPPVQGGQFLTPTQAYGPGGLPAGYYPPGTMGSPTGFTLGNSVPNIVSPLFYSSIGVGAAAAAIVYGGPAVAARAGTAVWYAHRAAQVAGAAGAADYGASALRRQQALQGLKQSGFWDKVKDFIGFYYITSSSNVVQFGRSAATGAALFNSGQGWQPIGRASVDIRWNQYSGTGNWIAGQTTKYFLAGGGYGGVPNFTATTADPGHTIFYGGGARFEDGVVVPRR